MTTTLVQDENNYVKLSSGGKMHKIGLGTWKAEKNVSKKVVYEALKRGYRHIDCAPIYANEKEIGEAFHQAFSEKICKRESVFITSKLWATNKRKKHVKEAFEKTLKDLQLDYLDLFLIHFPLCLKYVPFDLEYPYFFINPDSKKVEIDPVPLHETWEAMEELVQSGLVKSIGVSNFNTQLLQDLLSYAKIKPVVNQVELHPYLTQDNLINFCRNEGICVTAYSPFGGISYKDLGVWKDSDPQPLEEEVVKSIAKKHNKSPAQIILRWSTQRFDNLTVLVKTSNNERLTENLAVLDFELSKDEISQISQLNKNKRYNDPGVYCLKFNSFCSVFD